MTALCIFLFGRFHATYADRTILGLDAAKCQELFAYLLLYPDVPHHRETLAAQLWGDAPTAQSKKYLRQTLWQLQAALEAHGGPAARHVLVAEPDWVRVNPDAPLRLDVAEFEQQAAAGRGVPGHTLEAAAAQALKQAEQLYRGDLLEGCYRDWCLFERERLQNLYLDLLDKLIEYCTARQEYETGLAYGTRVLHFDLARERTHWQMMRLHFLAGDRTGALRQYERCAAALQQELGVEPAERTRWLYEQIRADQPPALLRDAEGANGVATVGAMAAAPPLPHVLGHLKEIQTTLTGIQNLVRRDIQSVENALNDPH